MIIGLAVCVTLLFMLFIFCISGGYKSVALPERKYFRKLFIFLILFTILFAIPCVWVDSTYVTEKVDSKYAMDSVTFASELDSKDLSENDVYVYKFVEKESDRYLFLVKNTKGANLGENLEIVLSEKVSVHEMEGASPYAVETVTTKTTHLPTWLVKMVFLEDYASQSTSYEIFVPYRAMVEITK